MIINSLLSYKKKYEGEYVKGYRCNVDFSERNVPQCISTYVWV